MNLPTPDLPGTNIAGPCCGPVPTDPTPAGQAPAGGPPGYVPVDVHTVIVVGPRWARPLSALAAVLAPVGRLLDRGLVTLVWAGLVGVGFVVTGHATTIGLSATSHGYRPIHLVLAGIAVLALTVICADVIGFGRRNAAVARAEQARRHTPPAVQQLDQQLDQAPVLPDEQHRTLGPVHLSDADGLSTAWPRDAA